MDSQFGHQIRKRLGRLQSENGEQLFEIICLESARKRIHKNFQMTNNIAGHGDEGRDTKKHSRIGSRFGDAFR